MSKLEARVEALEKASGQGDDEFIEALAERTRWLPDDEFAAILEMVEADLAGEDIEVTRPDELAALNAIIAEVRSEFTEANRGPGGPSG